MTETTCRACGAPIRFIKTKAGKTAPVNAEPVHFIPDPEGGDLFITPDGDAVRGWKIATESNAAYDGYTSHFATCTNPDYFRKPRKGDRRRAAT